MENSATPLEILSAEVEELKAQNLTLVNSILNLCDIIRKLDDNMNEDLDDVFNRLEYLEDKGIPA